ncbi:hypothetical protein L1987_80698 [Smallanthus sonchifolius]|uniref:Uncharacterized protein n=1 Tax=Smallanthus sonchifolius TaxID=185202 RepID=A0ACB8YNY9_9ASTR|nr:hypothetical protein L1987_80698 [Smallanthus sonchifolius]
MWWLDYSSLNLVEAIHSLSLQVVHYLMLHPLPLKLCGPHILVNVIDWNSHSTSGCHGVRSLGLVFLIQSALTSNLGLAAGGVDDRCTGDPVSSSQSDSAPGWKEGWVTRTHLSTLSFLGQNSSWAYTLFQPSCTSNATVGLMVMMRIVVD